MPHHTQSYFQIDKDLLPIKLHFFFFAGGYAGVLPFIPLVAEGIGIDASGVGITYGITYLLILFSNPLIGFLVDYFKNIRVFMISLILASVVSLICINILPAIDSEFGDSSGIKILNLNFSNAFRELSFKYHRACLEEALKSDVNCKLNWSGLSSSKYETYSCNVEDFLFRTFNFTDVNDVSHVLLKPYNNTPYDYFCPMQTNDIFLNCSPDIHHCLINDQGERHLFYSYHFWIFTLLFSVGQVAYSSCSSLGSVVCYGILGTRGHLYGQQRLFGTLSIGLIGGLAGVLNDLFFASNKYSSGFYILAVFAFIDSAILVRMPFPEVRYSSTIGNDVKKVLSSCEIMSFGVGILFSGAFRATIQLYEFLFLESLNASKTLFGLLIVMQCLVGEVPFLYLSGWIVRKFTYFPCLALVFAGYALRFLLYSMIQNPWLVLPVDILHGVTFGINHVATTAFSKAKTPPGLEATTYGVLVAMEEGLGYGIGSLLGGYGLEFLGGRKLYFIACVVCVLCTVVYLLVSFNYYSSHDNSEETEDESTQDSEQQIAALLPPTDHHEDITA